MVKVPEPYIRLYNTIVRRGARTHHYEEGIAGSVNLIRKQIFYAEGEI